MKNRMKNDDLNPREDKKHKQNPKVLNREVFYRGDNIIDQGDEGFRAYYIEKGRVEVLAKREGHELKIAELGPGDIFGEMSLINNEPRSATVRAMEDVTLTVISRDEVEGKIKRIDDKAIRALINVLCDRLRDTTHGQMEQYMSLADFQDRVTGIVDRAHDGIDESKRAAFRTEVEPLLADLQFVLDRYQK
jgi:CRP/FNR family transcriptional regulator, cyclic AMP receptor protein